MPHYLNSHKVRVSAAERTGSHTLGVCLILNASFSLFSELSLAHLCVSAVCGAQVPDVISVLKDSVISLTPVTHRHYPTRRRNSCSFKRTLWDLTEYFKCIQTHSPSVQPPPPWNECHYIVLHCTFHSSEQWSYWFILTILMKNMMIGGENRSDLKEGSWQLSAQRRSRLLVKDFSTIQKERSTQTWNSMSSASAPLY